MKVVTFISNCLRDPANARDAALVNSLVQGIVEQGFLLASNRGEYLTIIRPWSSLIFYADSQEAQSLSEQQRQYLLTPGMTDKLQADLSEYYAMNVQDLTIDALSTAQEEGLRGLDFLFTLTKTGDEESPEPFHLTYASTTWEYLATEEKRSFWMHLPLFLYRTWHPLFTYLAFEDDPRTLQAEAQAMKFHHLYNVNIFASEAVEHFGRDKMLGTPGALVTELEDGGVLLEPADMQRAAAHLGLQPTYLVR